MINFKYYSKGFLSIKGIDSPALALGASFVAIGALLKNLVYPTIFSAIILALLSNILGWKK